MLVYDNEEQEEDLMHYDIPSNMVSSVETSPNTMVYTLFPEREPLGYKVPLIQVGEMF